MNDILQAYLRGFVLVFFADILIYSKTWEEHLTHLKQVLETLQHHQWFKWIPRRLLQWPILKSLKALRGFLGLTGYYRRFIYHYGKMAKPLTQLLRKGCFVWTTKSTKALHKLKTTVSITPVLKMPDFSQAFCIECDVSGTGLGALLSQNKQPIAFFSKALAETSLTKSVNEKELMALVLAIQHWRPYLIGRRFTVYTDQKSLRYLLEQ